MASIEEELLKQIHAQQNSNQFQVGIKDVPVDRRELVVIVAVDCKGGYAKGTEIPWDYKADMKWFSRNTKGQICVMGRTTYEDMNVKVGDKGKESVLPGRTCFVVSSTLESLPNATVVRSLRDIDQHLKMDDKRKVFVLGGNRLFVEGVALADQVVMTMINKSFDCDKFFPVEYVAKYFGVKNSSIPEGDDPLNQDLRFIEWQRLPK